MYMLYFRMYLRSWPANQIGNEEHFRVLPYVATAVFPQPHISVF